MESLDETQANMGSYRGMRSDSVFINALKRPLWFPCLFFLKLICKCVWAQVQNILSMQKKWAKISSCEKFYIIYCCVLGSTALLLPQYDLHILLFLNFHPLQQWYKKHMCQRCTKQQVQRHSQIKEEGKAKTWGKVEWQQEYKRAWGCGKESDIEFEWNFRWLGHYSLTSSFLLWLFLWW